MSTISDCFNQINRKFILNNILTNNPLVKKMAIYYINFVKKCEEKNRTPQPTTLSGSADIFSGENEWSIQG